MALYTWGCNGAQQLGLGSDDKEVFDVQRVDALKQETLVDFSAGEQHSLGVNEFGDVFAWGRGKEGQLGLGSQSDEISVRTPQKVAALDGQIITKVSCGEMHSLALSVTGEVFQWGLLPERHEVKDDVFNHQSVSLTGLSTRPAERATSTAEIMARMMRYSEMIYEASDDAQALAKLRDSKSTTVRAPCFVPRICQSLAKYAITNIAAGFAHSLAVSACGAVFSCGYNDNGQLGSGTRRNSASFEQIQGLADYFVTDIACGQQHSLACTRIDDANPRMSGLCFAWGLGILGQLGCGVNLAWSPIDVPVPKPVATIAAGSHHSVAVTNDGQVYTWGHSEYGQHGAGELFYDLQHGSHYFFPRLQESLSSNNVRVTSISCSAHSTFAVTDKGQVYSWGWNAFGVLGNGKFQRSVHPEPLLGINDETAVRVGAGSNHGGAIVKRRGCHYSLRYDELLQQGWFSDVSFRLRGGTTLEAHSVVVGARCGYLKGLMRVLRSQQAEPSTNLVVDEFEDVDPHVFRAFLTFLYTNRLDVLSHRRTALAKLAERVLHDELEFACQRSWRRAVDNSTKRTDPFAEDMKQVLETPEHADVVFLWPQEDGQVERVLAHKAILAQVDYFHTMFTGGFSEGHAARNGDTSKGDMHEITLQYMQQDGMTTPTFRRLLLWIYTGSFELLATTMEPSDMMDLYVGASLIGLAVLASLCERHLATMLSATDVESANACLDFAERFDARRLKTMSQRILAKASKKHG
ncbi:TPA: hypothetical protein N0F65_003197 [Lagenidium giganteum]|uniref:BTB domain-containing protein n=1 Tax=Lagenidium giganteum TaxID=4803 RepID=A0AAV2ZAF7_9STRA|nr:TPA: hypothetical protein N0F65_003197 [Lagenidium giganteum]